MKSYTEEVVRSPLDARISGCFPSSKNEMSKHDFFPNLQSKQLHTNMLFPNPFQRSTSSRCPGCPFFPLSNFEGKFSFHFLFFLLFLRKKKMPSTSAFSILIFAIARLLLNLSFVHEKYIPECLTIAYLRTSLASHKRGDPSYHLTFMFLLRQKSLNKKT